MILNQKPHVSVVTPVYNGASYLSDCIESVLTQTYTQWDYTIINNCSTDRTLHIAREYAAHDSRIRVHTNDRLVRVIANFNIALRQISPQSKYCKVLAADDRLYPECLEKMVHLAEAHPSVAIVGAYGLKGTNVQWTGLLYPRTVINGREVCRWRLLGGSYIFGTPSSVLYRSHIVRRRCPFYNESNFHADSEACFEVLKEHDFGFIHQVLTVRGEDRKDSMGYLSKSLDTYLFMLLGELVRYGPLYLSEEEQKRRLREQLREYYRYLGGQLFRHRDRQFWDLHRSKLAAAGYPFNAARLVAGGISYFLDLLLNPKRTTEELIHWLHRTDSTF